MNISPEGLSVRPLYADNCTLVGRVSVLCPTGSRAIVVVRITKRKQIESILITTPSPVDVEIVVGIVAVTDKCVTTIRRLAFENHHAPLAQFAVDQRYPAIKRIRRTVDIPHSVVVAEIIFQSSSYI